jgi:hypothetical protein
MKLKKPLAADGLINQEAPAQGGGQPQQQGQQGGMSIDVQATLNMNGQQQQLQPMSIKSPDDLKQLVQYFMQVIQQVSGGGQQQPGAGGQPAGGDQGGQPQGGAPSGQ